MLRLFAQLDPPFLYGANCRRSARSSEPVKKSYVPILGIAANGYGKTAGRRRIFPVHSSFIHIARVNAMGLLPTIEADWGLLLTQPSA